MRHGRAKQARKTLQFFHRTIGLKAPYHVLLDGTFVVAFSQHNLPIQERLERLLHAQQSLTFCTTESVLHEVKTLVEKTTDDEKKAIFQAAHTWMVQNCSVTIKDIPAASLDWASSRRGSKEDYLGELSDAGRHLLTLLTHANGIGASDQDEASSSAETTPKVTPPLLVASQDEAFLHLSRQSGRVPVIRLARGSVLLLEQPSHAAQSAQQQAERAKWTVRGSVPEQEKLLVDLVKQQGRKEQRRTTTAPNPHERRKRKAKGPNPLSCKKKKDDKSKNKTS